MEDEYLVNLFGDQILFGVFDGHCGKRAATYASQNFSKVLESTNNKNSLE